MKRKLFAILFIVAAFIFSGSFYGSLMAAELSADVLVIGAGASGTTAALSALESGASVILLEKQPAAGGLGNIGEGIFAADSKMQKRMGIVVTPDMAFKTIMDYSHWKANPFVVRAFVNKSADTLDWINAHGVEFEYIGSGAPGGPMTWHIINGKGHGTHLMNVLRGKFLKDGGKLMLETPGTKLLTDKNGKVVGATAEDADGEKYNIKAKAVIIGTGGYANNKEWLEKYVGTSDIVMVGNAGKMGDGIRMAWEAGAAEEGMGVIQAYRPGLPGYPTNSHLLAAARQPYLWVSPAGERFTDESIVELWPSAGNALMQAGGRMWAIYDADTKNKFIKDGIDMHIGEWVIAGTKLDNLESEMKKAKEQGFVVEAASIEELAKKMNVDPKTLKRTVDLNNKFAAQRQDEIFAKNQKYIRPVAKGPFYATKMIPAALGTLGGVKINGDMRAVRNDGSVVEGLYVIGSDAGGMYGDTYDLLLGGGTYGFAVNSGRIAAEHAVKTYVK